MGRKSCEYETYIERGDSSRVKKKAGKGRRSFQLSFVPDRGKMRIIRAQRGIVLNTRGGNDESTRFESTNGANETLELTWKKRWKKRRAP